MYVSNNKHQIVLALYFRKCEQNLSRKIFNCLLLKD